MLVNPAKHALQELGRAFVDWLDSAEGLKAIADYKIDGQQLFFPNATDIRVRERCLIRSMSCRL